RGTQSFELRPGRRAGGISRCASKIEPGRQRDREGRLSVDYRTWRAAAARYVYERAIQRLVARYRRARPTLVLLPGGMGSQLDSSLAAHDPRALPPARFETMWADVGLLFNQDALTLEIDGRGRDRERHAIVPDGALG